MDLVALCHSANAPTITRLSILRDLADDQWLPIEAVEEWRRCWRFRTERLSLDPREKLNDPCGPNSPRESALRREFSSPPKMNWPTRAQRRPTLGSVMNNGPIEHLRDIGVPESFPRRLSTSQSTNNRTHLLPAFFFHE